MSRATMKRRYYKRSRTLDRNPKLKDLLFFTVVAVATMWVLSAAAETSLLGEFAMMVP